MNDIGLKLKEFFRNKGLTQQQVADTLGVTKAYVNRVLTGRVELGKANAEKWGNQFGLSSLWLLTGYGNMLNETIEDEPTKRFVETIKELGETAESIGKKSEVLTAELIRHFENKAAKISTAKAEELERLFPGRVDVAYIMTGRKTVAVPTGGAIRFYPNVEGVMGGVQFLENPNEEYVDMLIPGMGGNHLAIPAYGDSMSPKIKSGHIVLLSEWNERFVEYGKIYLVITRSGHRSIKYLFPAASPTALICRSENAAQYPDFEIERADIQKLYLVNGWVCRESL